MYKNVLYFGVRGGLGVGRGQGRGLEGGGKREPTKKIKNSPPNEIPRGKNARRLGEKKISLFFLRGCIFVGIKGL